MGTSPEDFRPFIDKFGLITQKDTAGADGGDSAHRFGIIYTCLLLSGKDTWVDGMTPLYEAYYNSINQYEQTKDVYVRHPDPDKWYSSPLNFSRDQTTMLMKAMLVQKDTLRLNGIMKQLVSHWGFHPNVYNNYVEPKDYGYEKTKTADIMTPSQIGDWLRGYRSALLYPVLCVIDSMKFVDVILAWSDDQKSKAKGKRTDYYTMLVTDVVVSRATQDTFVMKLAAKFLSKFDYKGAINWVFKPEHNDPPVNELLLPLAERYIDNAN